MSIRYGNNKIKEVYYGSNPIRQVYYGNQLVYSKYQYPTSKSVPSTVFENDFLSVSGANSASTTISQEGFYKVTVCGSRGHNGEYYTWGKTGGKVSRIVYLYKNSKIYIWASNGGSRNGVGATGFPVESDRDNAKLGGWGARGTGEGGGGGGSPTSSGQTPSHYDAGGGGGGAGFIAGLPYLTGNTNTFTNGNWSRSLAVNSPAIQNSWITTPEIYSYILAGGGGGGVGKNNYRVGGGGGGAWGNGGTAAQSTWQTGPGGAWGKGNNGGEYSGGDGAWCIMDFSRNQLEWGTGGGSDANGNGYVIVKKLDEYISGNFKIYDFFDNNDMSIYGLCFSRPANSSGFAEWTIPNPHNFYVGELFGTTVTIITEDTWYLKVTAVSGKNVTFILRANNTDYPDYNITATIS